MYRLIILSNYMCMCFICRLTNAFESINAKYRQNISCLEWLNLKSFGSPLKYIVIVRCPPLAVTSNYIVVWRYWRPLIAIVKKILPVLLKSCFLPLGWYRYSIVINNRTEHAQLKSGQSEYFFRSQHWILQQGVFKWMPRLILFNK